MVISDVCICITPLLILGMFIRVVIVIIESSYDLLFAYVMSALNYYLNLYVRLNNEVIIIYKFK